jgi:uncharacterized lipoprotein YehR (DUF1307 family)
MLKQLLKLNWILILVVLFTACEESKNSKPYLMNGGKNATNPNSLAYQTQDKALDRKNRIEMAEIEAKTKLEVAKIDSRKAVEIATIDSFTKKDVAKQTTGATVEISKVDAQTKDKQSLMNLYIAIGVIFAALIAMLLLYTSKKKSLEIKARLEENRLRHEFAMREKELQEQRIQKVLDLAISGKLPPDIQKEFISSLTNQDRKLIESK